MPTVLHRLSSWADSQPETPAQCYKAGNAWQTITAREYRDRVFYLALFLEARGFTPGDIGAILSYNCPQWVHMDLAPLLLGAKSAGMYPNSSAKDIAYIFEHTRAKVLSVQNAAYYKKVGGKLPASIELVVVFDGDTSVSSKAVSYEAALKEGKALAQGRKFIDYLARVNRNAGAFLIYTSGTTGNPKGAVLTHDNLAFTSDVVARAWGLKRGGGRSTFSFLPLCHVAEKMQNIGVGISSRYAVYHASTFDNVSSEIVEVQPTVLLSVPRLWEKMMEGVEKKVASGKGVKKHLAHWSFDVGARVAEKRFSGRNPGLADIAQLKLADGLVLSKVRHALGLGKIERAASGAAALAAPVSKWFRKLGIEVLEDYGQTESTGVICMTEPGVDCAGTVGRPPKEMEFKLGDDGEMLTRGRHVFLGYYENDAATAETLKDGWLYTGDLGELTATGLLRIRGRKKEIMKTSGGKMTAPVPIEERIKELPAISQACMVGDGRKYLSALVTLNEKETPAIAEQVKAHIDSVNRSLAGYEQIKQFRILPEDFSVDKGEMTPTLKLKRAVIEKNYQGMIDSMY
ncbi:MAG: long-chain fatty acid--CoA ligase [Deltaproteobacteria bacterium]|nr:long-chain fatty acid--CoA ligase [Deltaproteobacteria bacterium]